VRKIIFALAFGVLLLPDSGFTLGLGEIEVNTALNQELNAEIELLSAAPEDVETLIVKLASREEFIRAGIDRPYMLNSLKFSAEMRGDTPIIKVTSDKPIREPFLNFLIEIDWPKGHMMREYTILLDPPVFMGQQQAPVQQEQLRPAAMDSSRPAATETTPEPQSDSGFRPAAMGASAAVAAPGPAPVTAAPATRTQVAPSYSQSYYQSPGGYRIKQGDTLWSLADSMRPDQSVTIEQMMLAMLRTNPEAFINENVNGLKRGYVLRIPDRDDIIAVNQAEAVALVREQNALWREYQQAVVSAEPASAMDREAEGGAGAGIDAGSDARLEIVAAGSGKAASGSKDPTRMTESELRAELAIARESLETERVEKEELQQRVTTLEGQLDKMQALLTLEDADLAEMQQAAAPAEGEAAPETEAVETVAEEQLAEEMTGEQLEILEEAAVEGAAIEEEMAATDEAAIDEIAEQDVFLEQEQAGAADETVEQPVAPAEDFSVSPSTQPAFMQEQKQGLSALLNNPLLLAAAGGALLFVLLLIALIMKRRKAGAEEEPAVASNLEDIVDQAEASDVIAERGAEQAGQEAVAAAVVEAGTAEEAVEEAAADETDTASTVVMPSDEDAGTAQAETEAEGEETRDDIIAEADVYLAYGIYQQAEELLQNAIKDKPDNDSYRVKLAETYFAGKNKDAFIELATEMNERRGGEDTPAWKKIVAFGAQIAPEHGLFAGSAAEMVDELEMDDLVSHQPESTDIDLDSEAEPEAVAPELDLELDEESKPEEATEQAAEPAESVEFDLTETDADVTAEPEEETVEFDLAETQALEPDQAEEEFSLDLEASELGIEDEAETDEDHSDADVSFELDDVGADTAESLAADEEEAEDGLSLDDVDEASLDFDISGDEAGEPETAAEESQDEVAEVLDFTEELAEEPAAEVVESDIPETEAAEPEMSEPQNVETEAESVAFETPMDEDLDLSDLDDIDEVSTKLDLAKAYLDMGDADGTRSILDEVMSEGDDEQKKEAEELLRQLG
jgi:pilus assembly protein FimV